MRSKHEVLFIVTLVLVGNLWAAGPEKVLHAFENSKLGGLNPNSLIFDSHGNMFGTTEGGGSPLCAGGCGTVFEMVAGSSGWTYKPIYGFGGSKVHDGNAPNGLVFDANGNLFGTTNYGGEGGGTIFELTPNPSGEWTESMVFDVPNYNDGGIHGLALGPDGNFYGTAEFGGTMAEGSIFQFVPSGASGTFNTIWSFNEQIDGNYPRITVTFDDVGNIFTASQECLVELKPNGGGAWQESILHCFAGGLDGGLPSAPVTFDAAGDLFGTTYGGDGYDFGTVYMMQPSVGGGWSYKVLWNFHLFEGDGGYPIAPVTLDGEGGLYGTTGAGGNGVGNCGELGACGDGTIFHMSPNEDGIWKENGQFRFDVSDGAGPNTGLIVDSSGNYYSTTYSGGLGAGVVYQFVPPN